MIKVRETIEVRERSQVMMGGHCRLRVLLSFAVPPGWLAEPLSLSSWRCHGVTSFQPAGALCTTVTSR